MPQVLEGIPQAELNLPVCSESDPSPNGAIDRAKGAVALCAGAEGLTRLKLITCRPQCIGQDARRIGEVGSVKEVVELTMKLDKLSLSHLETLTQRQVKLANAGAVQCVSHIVAEAPRLWGCERCRIEK